MKHLTMRIEGDVSEKLGMKAILEQALHSARLTVSSFLECEDLPMWSGEDSVSIIAMLSDGHATIYTFPHDKYAMVDCFSCSASAMAMEAFADTWFSIGFAIIEKEVVER